MEISSTPMATGAGVFLNPALRYPQFDGLNLSTRVREEPVLKNGKAEEKRKILGCLKSRTLLADGKIRPLPAFVWVAI